MATLALTRSPRTTSPAELIHWDGHQCAVEARVRLPTATTTLAIRFDRDARGRAVRTTTVDGNARPARAILGICPMVLFSPEDLLLVSGAPEARRRQLDMLLAQIDPVTAGELLAYRRALAQRNALLRGLTAGRGGEAALSGFTSAVITHGAHIRRARAALVAALSPTAGAGLADISGGQDVLSLRYLADGRILAANEDLNACGQLMEAELRRRAPEERLRGMTLSGPHRDDVEMYLDGRPARQTASQGQQRSVVLAYKLAEVAHIRQTSGRAPVLLLDDVFGELDAARRDHLLAAIAAMGSLQLLVTATDAAPFPMSAFASRRVFTICDGVIATGKIE